MNAAQGSSGKKQPEETPDAMANTPGPVASRNPNAPAPSDPVAAQAEDLEQASSSGLTSKEERELGRLLRKRDAASAAGAGARFKVKGAHSELHFGGLVIGRDFTYVPENMIGPVATAAADAGVELTQEES
jgi:hypothetical protein